MEEYKTYLADRLFTEEKMVTYRTLSRALKVHVNSAKGMLYEFHRWQNAMSHGKVHATYLVYGTKSTGLQEDGDHEMTSSPPDMEPMGDEVPTQTLTLVAEERLKDVLATYQEVTSFQVYSLAPFPTKEYQLLSDVSRELSQYSHEDPVEMGPKYGSISNANMKRRERTKRPQPQPVSKPAEKKAAVPAVPGAAFKVKEEFKEVPAKEAPAKKTQATSAASGKAAPPLKRGGSSGIMSAFSKAAAKAPKAGSKPSSNASTPKPVDSPALSDDGEDDDEPLPVPKRASNDTGRKLRKDREAALRQMMEESEEEPEEEEEEKEEEPVDEPMEDVHEPELEPKTEPKAEPEPAEVVSSAGDGRRRGRRRVMKKVQKMDKEGYFITTQEEAWESFSEDEPAAAPAKAKASAPPSSGSQSKAKKPAGKGQGNIMSFFAKK